MNNCKDCMYWQRITENRQPTQKGICDYPGCMNSNKEPDKIFDIEVSVHDDSGLDVNIITGENFGCIHFCSKTESPTFLKMDKHILENMCIEHIGWERIVSRRLFNILLICVRRYTELSSFKARLSDLSGINITEISGFRNVGPKLIGELKSLLDYLNIKYEETV